MSNLNASIKEDYVYNHLNPGRDNVEGDIDIDLICDDLLKCNPQQKDMFDRYMKNVEREILGEGNFGDDEDIKKMIRKKNIDDINNFRASYRSDKNNLNPNEQKTLKKDMTQFQYSQNIFYSTIPGISEHFQKDQNFLMRNQTPGYINNNRNLGNSSPNSQIPEYLTKNRISFQKYTDVHANTKFYYPNEYDSSTNPYEKTDLMNNEPGQWNDRANRITMYITDPNPSQDNITRMENDQLYLTSSSRYGPMLNNANLDLPNSSRNKSSQFYNKF